MQRRVAVGTAGGIPGLKTPVNSTGAVSPGSYHGIFKFVILFQTAKQATVIKVHRRMGQGNSVKLNSVRLLLEAPYYLGLSLLSVYVVICGTSI